MILEGLRILVVDDDSGQRRLLEDLLGREGATLVHAENGACAWRLCEEHAFDLALMDIQMPEMDGIAATHRIRKLDNSNAAIPIIAVTAFGSTENRKQLLSHGFDDYVAKPVDPELLIDIVASWLERERVPTEVPPCEDVSQMRQSEFRDVRQALRITGGNIPLAEELFSKFLDDAYDMRASLRICVDANDVKELKDKAHQLHGAAAYCGLPYIKQAAYDIEQCIRNCETGQLANCVVKVDTLLKALLDEQQHKH